MDDLFEREEAVLKQAAEYLDTLHGQNNCDRREFEKLAREYARILKLVRQMTKITDKTAEELNADRVELRDKVHFDVLTGIYSRRYFEEELPQVICQCRKNGRPLGFLMLDVDFFKQYNDNYGHSMGDDCLRKIGFVLKKSLEGKEGFAARYGGEEFTAILPGTDYLQIKEMADLIRKNLSDLQIPHIKNVNKGYVTISIGGISTKVLPEMGVEDFVRYADIALYQSKQTGRDKFTLFRLEED